MNHLLRSPPRTPSGAHAAPRIASIIAMAVSVTTLSACGSVSDITKERVSNSTVAVNQTEQTLGRSEDGMVELQRAKESLAAAQGAVARKDDKGAQRFAAQSQLHAQLAVAQSQSAAARRAADEVLASTNALRRESERAPTTPNTP